MTATLEKSQLIIDICVDGQHTFDIVLERSSSYEQL